MALISKLTTEKVKMSGKGGRLIFPVEYSPDSPFVHFFPKQYKYDFSESKKASISPSDSNKSTAAVSIYMPGAFSESLGNSWERQAIIGGGAGDWKDALSSVVTDVANNFAGGKLGSTIKAYFGVAIQPTEMLVFNGIEPIKTNFKFQIIPYSEKETDVIQKIILQFKQSMLPKRSNDSTLALLHYPKVWDIHFTGVRGMGIEYENAYTDMALTSCNVSYSHGENFLVYSDGGPVELTLDLSFESVRRPVQNNEDIAYIDNNLGAPVKAVVNWAEGKINTEAGQQSTTKQ